MRKNNGYTGMSNRDNILKIIMLTLIVIIMAGAVAFIFTGIFRNGDQPPPANVPVTTPDLSTSSERDPDTDSPDNTEGDNGYEPVSTPAVPSEPDVDPDQPATPSETITMISIEESYPDLHAKLDVESASHSSVGVSLVVYDGHTGDYYAYQYGFADRSAGRKVDAETKFRIASLSKFIVTICAMSLVDSGLLDIDEDISAYLGYEVKSPGFPNTPITSRMLMQQTSSIYDSAGFMESLDRGTMNATQRLLSRNSTFTGTRPGSTYQYSNFGIAVLGAVVELTSGKKLDAYVHEILFAPLDIDAAFLPSNIKDTDSIANIYNPQKLTLPAATQLRRSASSDLGQDQSLGYGSLVISAVDYAKILAMLGNGGVFLGERILSSESVAEIHNADFSGPGFMQGLTSRYTGGGAGNIPADSDDIRLWLYTDKDGNSIPSEGFYWHTGSAWGLFSQYIYVAGRGTDEGIGGVNTSRGVLVITTGASTRRMSNGMVNVCNHLSAIAWEGLGFDKTG